MHKYWVLFVAIRELHPTLFNYKIAAYIYYNPTFDLIYDVYSDQLAVLFFPVYDIWKC